MTKLQFERLTAEMVTKTKEDPGMITQVAIYIALKVAEMDDPRFAGEDGDCVFCGAYHFNPHEADCLWMVARALTNTVQNAVQSKKEPPASEAGGGK